jgi:small subunit ribosomal protein S2
LSTSTPLKTTDRLRLSLKSKIALLSLKRFIQSSGHLGHRPLKLSLSRVCYPAASTLLIGERGTGAIINPSVTLQQTAKGLFLGASLLRQKGKILIIDTRGEISPIGSLIEKHNSKIPSFLSFSGNRWVGGSLTNWSSISEMIGRSAQIKTKFQGFLEKTRILLPRYEKMKQAYPGFLHSIKSGAEMRLIRHPDLLFLINPNENRHVIEEARTLKIPVIALVDSNTDLSDITIPIPVNYNSQFWSNAIVNILIDLATSLSKKRVFSCKQKSIPVKTIRKPSLNGI